MELRPKKNAVALIELLIALTMTSILMLMLFGIVTKKTKSGIVHQDGVFYCWKSWNGDLYQKNSVDSIKKVSKCKIKIPKDAKNIKVYLVGGGSGGYRFDKTQINNILKSGSNYKSVTEKLECIKPVENEIYTKIFYTDDECTYSVMTTCKRDNCADEEMKVNMNNYKSLSTIIADPPDGSPFNSSFVKNLFEKGYCYIPIYENGEMKYISSSSSMASNNLYYYRGSSEISHKCKGYCEGPLEKDKENCEQLTTTMCSIRSEGEGDCYQDGVLKTNSEVFSPSEESYSNDINKFNYKSLSSSINLGVFQKSMPGDIKKSSANAGREYVIQAGDIGNGGQAGQSGGKTKFGNLVANGGELKESNDIIINTNVGEGIISSISDIDKVSQKISICSGSDIECSGSINELLNNKIVSNGIKINSGTAINPAVFQNNTWVYDSNPQYSFDDITKTGFGFFGASGAALDCLISYYPVLGVNYNGLADLTSKNGSRVAKIKSCATGGNGMGGAIIIKWD